VRNIWCDAYRILIETQNTEIDLEETVDKLFRHSPDEALSLFEEYIERSFPYGYYLKFVAERFGAIQRGRFPGEGQLTRIAGWLRDTLMYT